MAFTLIFTIGLSVILLLGAFFICKSDLPTNDKIISIIAILALFSLVSIINEAKKTQPGGVEYDVGSFHKSFFALPDSLSTSGYALPALDGSREFVLESLEGFDPEIPNNYQFAFVFSNHKVGKSSAFKEYANELHTRNVPALYLNIESPSTNVTQLVRKLKIPSLNSLDDLVDKQNREGKVPNIFVDNIHNAFVPFDKSADEVPCPLCEYFKSLFDNKRVNVVFISNQAETRDFLRSTESYNRRLSFFEINDRNSEDIDSQWLENVNQNIKKDDKKFTTDSFRNFVKFFGWDFDTINDYVSKIDSYENVKDFVDKSVHHQSQKISSKESTADLIRALVALTREKNENFWMSYGLIKKKLGGNPLDKLDEAVRADILAKKGNQYRFKNQATYHSALVSEGFKVNEL